MKEDRPDKPTSTSDLPKGDVAASEKAPMVLVDLVMLGRKVNGLEHYSGGAIFEEISAAELGAYLTPVEVLKKLQSHKIFLEKNNCPNK